MLARSLAVLVAALVLAPAAAASAPTGLHGFVLRSSEHPSPHTFARTPSFAWNRVAGAARYEFELSSSKSFAENAIVWESASVRAPLTTAPLTLPWVSGSPYSWYARVRAHVGRKVTRWSGSYGFNLRAPAAPRSLSNGNNTRPGLIRWTPVAGANAYEVTFRYDPVNGDSKSFMTQTTAADLREYYDFHNDPAAFAPLGYVEWRVRAVRATTGKTKNGVPVVSYGPWSTSNHTVEPDLTGVNAPIALHGTISRSGGSSVVSSGKAPAKAHELVPAFWWSGNRTMDGLLGACPPDVAAAAPGLTCPLYHVYVYTDRECVNRVYTSDLVGSTAYAPRLTGPIELPSNPGTLADARSLYLAEGSGEGADVFAAGAEQVYAAGTDPDLSADSTRLPGSDQALRRTGLWDTDRASGRYWWTVVPAVPRITPGNKVEYRDVEFAGDKCEAGKYMAFKKTSDVATSGSAGVPYASGQVSNGSVRAASSKKPAFYGRIVAAWKPAPGAMRYEIQWSKRKDPWKTADKETTPETSARLNLEPGVWYYRVRGIDESIPGVVQGMTWSSPQYVRIRPRTFTVGRIARQQAR